jgi:hypothetical protein
MSSSDQASKAGAALVRLRWAGTTPEERKAAMAEGMGAGGGRAAWAGKSKAERSEEMKRRAAVRKTKRRKGAAKTRGAQ